jgi:O-antigen/teichoic acid export membrane protein
MTADDGPRRRPQGEGDSIGRNAAFALATQIGTGIFTAALTIFLVRQLGPSGYGTFALALAISGTLLIPSDLGISQATARFVAERVGEPSHVGGVTAMALRLRLLTAGAIALALAALAGPIADAYGASDLEWPLRVVAIAFFGQSVMRLIGIVFVALRRASRDFAVVLSESAVELTSSVALVLLGAGVTGAALGRAVGYAFGAVLSVLLIARLLGRSPFRRARRNPVAWRPFIRYAGAMLVVSGALAIFAQIDVLLIGGIIGSSAAGLFAAPLRLITVFEYVGLAVAAGVAPRLARRPGVPPDAAALAQGLRYVIVFQTALMAVAIVWAGPIVELTLGSEFEESSEVLRALVPFIFLRGLSPVLSSPLNYAGEGSRRIPAAVATLSLNVVLDVILIPEIGILGGAIGTDVSFALYIAAHVWLCNRLFGLRVGPLFISFARSLAAGAALAFVLLAVGTHDLGASDWVAGLFGGGLVFTVALLATRETTTGEIALFVRRAGAVVRGA